MKRIDELEAGDEVLVIPTYRNAATGTPGRVTKVNRVWMLVKIHGRVERFRRDNGWGVGDPAQYRITTPELAADARRRDEIALELRKCGFAYYGTSLSTAGLERILSIVREE